MGVKKEGKKNPHTEFISLQIFFVVVWGFSLMNHRPGEAEMDS